MTEEQFAEILTQMTEKYAESIDRAMTKTSLELLKVHPDILSSAQMSALLMVVARRSIRAKLPDVAAFAALKEAMTCAKEEVKASSNPDATAR